MWIDPTQGVETHEEETVVTIKEVTIYETDDGQQFAGALNEQNNDRNAGIYSFMVGVDRRASS